MTESSQHRWDRREDRYEGIINCLRAVGESPFVHPLSIQLLGIHLGTRGAMEMCVMTALQPGYREGPEGWNGLDEIWQTCEVCDLDESLCNL